MLQKDANPFQKDGFTVSWWQQLTRGVDFTLDKLSWKYTELSEELSDVSNPCIHLNSCCGPEALACCIISFTPPSKVGVRCLVKRMLYSWIQTVFHLH
jgi:hypothetical protein